MDKKITTSAPVRSTAFSPAGAAVRRTFSGGLDTRQFAHEVLDVARVVRVVKGGRRFSFRAIVIVGNRAGRVGLGMGKSKDVQAAINKAYEQGVKHMINVLIKDGTIWREAYATYNSSRVMLKPARPGTGMIAGGTVRLLSELAGLHDIVSKRWGSPNKMNTAKAALLAMQKIKRPVIAGQIKE